MTNPETPSTAPVAWCRSDDFLNALLKRQSFSGWREQHPNCDMALYAQPQASAAPDADQSEGPHLDDVAELCTEFGFDLLDDDFGESIGILRDMITAALTRWRAPVAEPVATPAPQEPDVDRVLKLAAIIREVDLNPDANTFVLGWDELAKAILAHPGFSVCHDGPVALPAPDHLSLIGFAFGREPWATWLRQGGCLESAHCELSDLMLAVLARWGSPTALPAQGEVEELVEFLDGVADLQPHLCHADKVRRAAELLKVLWMGGWIAPTVEQQPPPTGNPSPALHPSPLAIDP